MIAAACGVVVGAGFLLRPFVTSVLNREVMQAARLADGRSSLERVATVRPAQVTTGGGFEGQPAFSRDGTTLAFSSDRTGSFEIYVQSLTPGAAPTALTTNGRANIQPAWSPDGRFIAYHEAAAGGIWMVPSRGGSKARRRNRDSTQPSTNLNGVTPVV